MRLYTRLFAAVALVAFIGVAIAPALAQGETGYKLRRVFKVNDIRRYKMVMDMNGEMKMGETTMPLNMQMIMTMREKVAGIKDGKATLVTTIESMRMLMNGQEFPAMPNMQNINITSVVDNRNQVHEIKGLETLAAAGPGMGNMNMGPGMNTPAPFPEEEVKVGDTWVLDVPIPIAKDVIISVKQTLVGIEKVGGIDAARIKAEVELPFDRMMAAMRQQQPGMPAMTGTMTMISSTWYDLATGNVLKVDGEGVMNMQLGAALDGPPSGMNMIMNIKLTLTQVRESAPAAK